ncbi:MAG: glutathione S-transferase family protein [Myxococcota bacterium]|jgi:glutathione S-transferase|nr:glutathione S-transferase family protein [Myxococcota bacterium]
MAAGFTVYGVKVSYFCGKLETYLHQKGLAYEHLPLHPNIRKVVAEVGTSQVPALVFPDGRWATDTTPIIETIESIHPQPTILPSDPAVAFVAWLIEDYADEYLWRSAMHYRWSYEHDRALLSRKIVDEIATHVRAPRFLKLHRVKKRQFGGFVKNDGVTNETREHVEQGYFRALDAMVGVLRKRPYLLGDFSSIADIGMMGPMFRHFGQDPTPEEIMRERAPEVYEWVARMWNTRDADREPVFPTSFPADLEPLMREVCETHLVQLRENAAAYTRDVEHFDAEIQGCPYRALPVSRYRVWCLERLRERFAALSTDDAARVRKELPYEGATLLWDDTAFSPSQYDTERKAPFNRAINVYGKGVPGS